MDKIVVLTNALCSHGDVVQYLVAWAKASSDYHIVEENIILQEC